MSCFATSFDAASQCGLQNLTPVFTAHEHAGCAQVSTSMCSEPSSEQQDDDDQKNRSAESVVHCPSAEAWWSKRHTVPTRTRLARWWAENRRRGRRRGTRPAKSSTAAAA